MVEVASCLRIFSGSRQYSRYLQGTHSEDKSLIQMFNSQEPAEITQHAGVTTIVLGSSSWISVMLQKWPMKGLHKQWEHYLTQCECYSPVQQPGLFGAGQGVHKFICFRSNGSILIHGPSKVPLFHSSCCKCTAVHCGLQVGINPGTINTNDEELWKKWKNHRVKVGGGWYRPKNLGAKHIH